MQYQQQKQQIKSEAIRPPEAAAAGGKKKKQTSSGHLEKPSKKSKGNSSMQAAFKMVGGSKISKEIGGSVGSVDQEIDTAVDIPHLTDLVEYLCTQKGSRTMQDFLKNPPINSINLIIENIIDNFDRLMCDSYANYFCQSLVRIIGAEQRLKILKKHKDKFVTVACDSVGTHSM